MSTVAEVIQATQKLAPEERWELYRQLREAADIQHHQLAELRHDVQTGIAEIESGDLAPLDISRERQHLAGEFQTYDSPARGQRSQA